MGDYLEFQELYHPNGSVEVGWTSNNPNIWKAVLKAIKQVAKKYIPKSKRWLISKHLVPEYLSITRTGWEKYNVSVKAVSVSESNTNVPNISPIETSYKGYRFRSRLEARWAVFFDALGIEWEYEREGYDLGIDGYYLPDFWIPAPAFHRAEFGTPESGYFVEIKPLIYPAIPKAEESYKAWALTEQTKHIVFIFMGEPLKHIRFSFNKNTSHNRGSTQELEKYTECFDGKNEVPFNPFERFFAGQWKNEDGSKYWFDCRPAARKARSARFEYGQMP